MVNTSSRELNSPTHVIPKTSILDLFDFCKGVAILLIVLVHYQGDWFGWQGVHVFIVLSGFGLTYACLKRGANLSWKHWYFRRLAKILPAYWLVCLLGYCVMAITYMIDGHSLLEAFSFPKRLLLIEVSLLKNFSQSLILTTPNIALWFVPFIISFYLAFPWLYSFMARRQSIARLGCIFLGMVSLEFLYRAIAIYALDGYPIGYRTVDNYSVLIGLPVDKIPDSGFPFQGEAPFGWFISRLGEFGLGMIAAIGFRNREKKFQRLILNRWTAIAGLVIWLLGNALLYAGFYGWVIADFVIAVGLVLWLVNLANFSQAQATLIFRKMTSLGKESYYIFLVHFPFIYLLLLYASEKTGINLSLLDVDSGLNLILSGIVAILIIWGTRVAARLLQRFDQSKFLAFMVQKTVTRWVN